MAPQDIQNQDMSLNLSTDDAKPRLKWTTLLHQRFIDAIGQLGGADKATPKSLMRVMGIHGLTLYHLKSHLQKYRQGKQRQQSQTYNDDHQEDNTENQRNHFSVEYSDETQYRHNESSPVSQALQIQTEVQRKLQEQIKVQRHLQLRIEAQRKYLQSVLKKAQDTLACYSSSSVQAELAKAELSQLVSMVDNGCPSSSISAVTSSESSGRKEDVQQRGKSDHDGLKRDSLVLLLMDTCGREKSGYGNEGSGSGRKRSGSSISDGSCVEQPSGKRSILDDRHKEFGLLETIDLNNQYVSELDSVPKAIDLNGTE